MKIGRVKWLARNKRNPDEAFRAAERAVLADPSSESAMRALLVQIDRAKKRPSRDVVAIIRKVSMDGPAWVREKSPEWHLMWRRLSEAHRAAGIAEADEKSWQYMGTQPDGRHGFRLRPEHRTDPGENFGRLVAQIPGSWGSGRRTVGETDSRTLAMRTLWVEGRGWVGNKRTNPGTRYRIRSTTRTGGPRTFIIEALGVDRGGRKRFQSLTHMGIPRVHSYADAVVALRALEAGNPKKTRKRVVLKNRASSETLDALAEIQAGRGEIGMDELRQGAGLEAGARKVLLALVEVYRGGGAFTQPEASREIQMKGSRGQRLSRATASIELGKALPTLVRKGYAVEAGKSLGPKGRPGPMRYGVTKVGEERALAEAVLEQESAGESLAETEIARIEALGEFLAGSRGPLSGKFYRPRLAVKESPGHKLPALQKGRIRKAGYRVNPTLADAAEAWAKKRGLKVPARGSAAWSGLYASWTKHGMASNPYVPAGDSFTGAFPGLPLEVQLLDALSAVPTGDERGRRVALTTGRYRIFSTDPAAPEFLGAWTSLEGAREFMSRLGYRVTKSGTWLRHRRNPKVKKMSMCSACGARAATEVIRDASGKMPVCEPCADRFYGTAGPQGARRPGVPGLVSENPKRGTVKKKPKKAKKKAPKSLKARAKALAKKLRAKIKAAAKRFRSKGGKKNPAAVLGLATLANPTEGKLILRVIRDLERSLRASQKEFPGGIVVKSARGTSYPQTDLRQAIGQMKKELQRVRGQKPHGKKGNPLTAREAKQILAEAAKARRQAGRQLISARRNKSHIMLASSEWSAGEANGRAEVVLKHGPKNRKLEGPALWANRKANRIDYQALGTAEKWEREAHGGKYAARNPKRNPKADLIGGVHALERAITKEIPGIVTHEPETYYDEDGNPGKIITAAIGGGELVEFYLESVPRAWRLLWKVRGFYGPAIREGAAKGSILKVISAAVRIVRAESEHLRKNPKRKPKKAKKAARFTGKAGKKRARKARGTSSSFRGAKLGKTVRFGDLSKSMQKHYRKAAMASARFDGIPLAEVTAEFVRVTTPAPRGLVRVGDLAAVEYVVGEKRSKRAGVTWRHKAGDHGAGKKRTRPPVLAVDPHTKAQVLVSRRGSRAGFSSERGLIG